MAMAKSSRFSHLLSTNEPPSHVEVAQLRQGVQTMVPQVLLLRQELKTLEDKLQLCYIVLSPTRCLPPEILNEIFGWVDERTLISVSLVCRAWHASATVLSSKSLSTTTIRFKSEDGIPSHKILSWLAKPVAGTKTLNIEHEVSYREHPCKCFKSANPCPWATPEFVGILAKNSALAWMVLGLKFSSPNCLSRLVASVGDTPSWNLLDTLHLHLSGNWPGRATRYRNALDGLPITLKHLSLKFDSTKARRQPPPIEVPEAPFNVLKSLSIECTWDSPFVLSLLRPCVDLEGLFIVERAGCHTWTESVAQVALPKVHTLHLRCRNDRGPDKILSLLRLPELTSLTVDGGPGSNVNCSGFLRRSLSSLRLLSPTPPSSLRTLVIKSINSLSSDDLWDVFSHFPSLRHLVFKRVYFEGASFLDGYQTRTGGGAQLLPALQKFELRELDERFDVESFLSFAQDHHRTTTRAQAREDYEGSRVPGGLQNISLHYGLWFSNDKFEAIKKRCESTVRVLEDDFGVIVQMTRV